MDTEIVPELIAAGVVLEHRIGAWVVVKGLGPLVVAFTEMITAEPDCPTPTTE